MSAQVSLEVVVVLPHDKFEKGEIPDGHEHSFTRHVVFFW